MYFKQVLTYVSLSTMNLERDWANINLNGELEETQVDLEQRNSRSR